VARSPATLFCAAQINGDERTPVAVGTPVGRSGRTALRPPRHPAWVAGRPAT